MVFVRTLDQAKTRVKKIAILSPIEDDIAFEMRNGQVVRTIARGKVDDSEEKEEKPEWCRGKEHAWGNLNKICRELWTRSFLCREVGFLCKRVDCHTEGPFHSFAGRYAFVPGMIPSQEGSLHHKRSPS